MLADLEDTRDEHLAQILMNGHDTVHRCDLARQTVSDVLALQRAAEQGFEPTTGNYHGVRSLDSGAGPSDSRS